MFNKIKEHIKKYELKEGDIVLLACSGGIDSMVLFDVFKKLDNQRRKIKRLRKVICKK